jgi:SulP family sulfate permease
VPRSFFVPELGRCSGRGRAKSAAGVAANPWKGEDVQTSSMTVRGFGHSLTHLSTLAAGLFLLLFILVLSDYLVLIPMGALVAVMFMVSIGTFDWQSLRTLHTVPRGETAVMLLTVATVVWTHDLAMGVFAGVILSALLFAWKVADVAFMEDVLSDDGRVRTYAVTGNLFFVTVEGFLAHFQFQEDVDRVVLDLSRSHVWDHSAVAAIDKAVLRFRRRGVEVELVGLNEASATLISRLAMHDKPGAVEMAPGH